MRRVAAWIFAIFFLALGCVPARAEKRVALVIGNSEYQHVPRLENPKNDAGDMRAKLDALGFQLFGGADLDRSTMMAALTRFGRAAENADVAVVFYAGHGLQVNGQNYLVPVDANVEFEAELDIALVPMSIVMQQLARGSRINIAMLDACRDNPFAKGLSRSMGTRAVGALGRGLSPMRSTAGTYIAYATAPDSVAQDGEGRNSPFTSALLKFIDRAGLSLSDLMIEVRNDVIQATNGKQIPWDTSSLTGRFYFKIEGTVTVTPESAQPGTPSPPPSTRPQPLVDAKTLELSVWNAIQDSTEIAAYEKFLADFPDGVFASAARDRIAKLRALAADLPSKPRIPTLQDACARPAVIDDDFSKSATVGIAHGVAFATGPNGGANFSRRRESRIVYPYARTGFPRSGTLEWVIKVSGGYFYSGGRLNERAGCALIFTTDIQNGDVTWPGSAWLYVCSNGDIRFHIAGAKYEAGGRPEYRLEAKATAFGYDQWHRVGVSYGDQGRYIMLDGKVVASNATMIQQLGAGGTHQAPIDHPTIGESVSGFWGNNQHEGGFEGTCARFRASDEQRNWCLSR